MEDKEREIRLQFLDEAGEYLDTLEGALLGVAQRGVDNHEMNAALRAAHSIKGGAALMGYGLTSDLAHRLEDSLKVVKINRGEGVTSDVEGQLLSGIDAIRQIVERDRTQQPIDDNWVGSFVTPIFDGLYDTLGEPSAEDAASMMDADEGQDVMPLIFQTEVESSLERLEALLEERPVNLQEEVVVMAQELSALGEMLDLPPFIQLCQSVETYAAKAESNTQLQEVGQKALQVWRRAQALVVTGNADSMPSDLNGVSFGLIDIEVDGTAVNGQSATSVDDVQTLGDENDDLVGSVFDFGEEDDALVDSVFANLDQTEDQTETADVDLLDAETVDNSQLDEGFGEGFDEGGADSFGGSTVGGSTVAPEAPLIGTDDSQPSADADAFAGVFDEDETVKKSQQTPGRSGTEFRFSEAPKVQSDAPDLADNTVRVSVRKLNDLNDYFGELTIERNRLEAEVKRMRSLVKNLGQKLRSLDEINDDVKDIYEQPNGPFLLTGSAPSNALPGSAYGGSIEFGSINTASEFGSINTASEFGSIDTDTPDVGEPASNGAENTAQNSAASTSTNGNGTSSEFRKDFDSLEFDRYNDAHLPFRQIVESVVKLQEVADDIELSVDKTEQTARVIHRTARHIQRNLNQLRMRPLSDITNRFPRALRELEIEHGKSVSLQLEGENTLIDRNILESLNDPLMHIVRNAFDHGIEQPNTRESQGKGGTGTIEIKAFNRSNRTVITVKDDGNGIALEKIRDRAQSMGLDADLLSVATEAELLSLIFEPGFSTSDQVTALSGRGVGMDVVRNNLTQIRGDISVDTEAGKGTTFTISVPYTLSVTRVMLAEGNRMPVALPTDMIEEVTIVDLEDMYETDGKPMFHFKGDAVRLIKLSNWLAFNCTRQIDSLEEAPNMDRPSVLIFRLNEQRIGLQVERSWGEQEVAVRRVEGPIALPAGFSNCTILGDGRVVPLVSLSDLARWVLSCEGSDINSASALYSNPVVSGTMDAASLRIVPEKTVNRRSRFLVIDDSVNVRRLLALTLEKVGYEVIQARDGRDALDKLETGVEIDSVVCDVEMPRMDGYSFLSKLRAMDRFTDIPVTMLTSRSGDKHRQLAMNLGATAYFSKPYQERVLLKSLAENLAQYLANATDNSV
ncbi:MAG: response regulator, partial [Cyanobacteria bacterium J06629_19]